MELKQTTLKTCDSLERSSESWRGFVRKEVPDEHRLAASDERVLVRREQHARHWLRVTNKHLSTQQ